MTVIWQEMFQNLKASAFLHNGKNAGYLGILMDPTIYATDYGCAFVPHIDPGNYLYLPTMATMHQREEA